MSNAQRPHVLLDLDYREGLFYLLLVNAGQGAAYRVRVQFSRELGRVDGAPEVSRMALFRGLSLLRPGKTIEVLWAPAAQVLTATAEPHFEAAVRYRDREGEEYEERFRHDPAVYRDWVQVRPSESG